MCEVGSGPRRRVVRAAATARRRLGIRGRRLWAGVVAVSAAVAMATTVSVAWAATAPAGSVGRDVSYPQCGAETVNSWNGDGRANTADLQGMFDRLRTAGVVEVGIYSTARQWAAITGGYTRTSANTYRTAWRRAFTPRFPMEVAPLWVATGGDRAGASTACGASFTGGPTRLAQYLDGAGFDADLVCPRR